MTLREDIFSALTSGSPTPIRVYFTQVLPPNVTLPAVTFRAVGGHDEMHLGGRAGLIRRVWELNSWATTELSAEVLMRQASQLMHGSTNFTVDVVNETPASGYEEETRRYRISYEFTLWAQDP